MKLWKKRLVITVIALLTVYFGYKAVLAYDRRCDGFTLEKITSQLPYNSQWDVAVTREQIDRANVILKQPFYYLARGFQCYAFQSADGKYVLKFVRHQRLRLSEYARFLPDIGFIDRWKKHKIAEGNKRANYLFSSLKTAFEAVPAETALVFVHINKTKGRHGSVTIIDRIGDRYTIQLDDFEFVLQKKANWIEPTIDKLMSEGRVDEAKVRIDQIFQLLADCAHKGIQDQDGALIRKHNLGFLDDRAIDIDSGKLTSKVGIRKRARFTEDLQRLRPLKKWLQERYPGLALHFEKAQKQAIERF